MYDVFKLDRREIKYVKLDQYKNKIIKKQSAKSVSDIDTFINNYKNISSGVICGNSSFIKKIKIPLNWVLHVKDINNNEIIKLFERNKMRNNLDGLDELFKELERDNNRILYGMLEKHIKNSIEERRVQKLYVHKKKLDDFKKCIDQYYINFEVIEIERVDIGDSGDKLLNDFGGFIGKLYY